MVQQEADLTISALVDAFLAEYNSALALAASMVNGISVPVVEYNKVDSQHSIIDSNTISQLIINGIQHMD